MTLMIFSPATSPSDPPNVEKSCAYTATVRPWIVADAGDDRIPVRAGLVHAERGCAVTDVLVEFDEAAGVHQQLDALARGELALRVLLVVRGLLGVDDRLLIARSKVRDLSGGGREVGLIGHAFHLIGGCSATVGGFAQGLRGIRCRRAMRCRVRA